MRKSIFCILFLVSFSTTTNIAQVYTFPINDNFENGVFENFWAPMPNLSGIEGVVVVSEFTPLNSSFSLQMGKTTDGGFTTNAADLYVDLSGQSNVKLTFDIYRYGEETHIQDGLFFSDNGGSSFTKVLDFKPELWCDYFYGRFPPIDVSKLIAAHGLSHSSQFIIRFQQHDNADFAFSGDEDGLMIDNVEVYSDPCPFATLPFEDNFDTGTLKDSWQWVFGEDTSFPATDVTVIHGFTGVTESTGIGGSYGLQMGKTCDGTPHTNSIDLCLDLSGQTDVKLSFKIYNYDDETHIQDGIYLSDDGGQTFTKVIDFKPGLWFEYSYGQTPPHDLSKLINDNGLSHSDQFVIRFQQYDNGDFGFSGDEDGYYLDDVNVYSDPRNYSSLPFSDNFDNGTFKDSWQWVFGDSTSLPATNVTLISGLLAVTESTGTNGSFGLQMGKVSDGNSHTNAIDLSLNLSGTSDVKLSFSLYDYAEETHIQDGVFLSDNGGLSFKKVIDFKPELWCDYVYGQFPPFDLSKLITDNGLTHSEQFIIRFQQYDNGDFGFSGDEDGFYLDDIHVYSAPCIFATLPFEDNFDNGIFMDSWQRAFGDSTALPATDVSLLEGYIGIEDGAGLGGSFGVKMGKVCDGNPHVNALDLCLNLNGTNDVKLLFDLYDFVDETHIQDGLFFSDNGGSSFTKVLDFKPELWCDYQYGKLPPIDVSKLIVDNGLSHSSQFIIRFQQYDNADFSTSGDEDGFYLDNVKVYSAPCNFATLPFFDDFENGILENHWQQAFGDNTSLPATDVTLLEGRIDVVSGAGINNGFGLQMGKNCDGNLSTNALDLCLNIQNESHVKLSFNIYDYSDELHIQDGLYFSDNGGITFTKVLDFRPDLWCDYTYGQLPPIDISKLILENGLVHSDQFIIRFQQYDNADFSTSGDEDGFYIDNVHLYSDPPIYASLPFTDNFNSGVFNESWQWTFGDSTSLPTTDVTITSAFVAVVDGIGINSSHGVQMGKICDENNATNALDLHLDLSNAAGCDDLRLQFQLSDYSDENQIQDGLFFSNDGGASFHLLYSFLPENYTDFSYQLFDLDLDDLINNIGIPLTSTSVIRFQQFDNADFSTSGDEDGFYIDDVTVFSATNMLSETVGICAGETYNGFSQSGVYTDTLFSSLGCDTVYTLNLTVNPEINLDNSNIQNDLDNTTNGEGSILANVSGGTPPFSFNWSNGTNMNPAINLLAGPYQLTVTDAMGCTNTFPLNVPLDMIESVFSFAVKTLLKVFPNPANQQIHIEWPNKIEGAVSFYFINSLGQKTAGANIFSHGNFSTIPIEYLAPGLWFIKATTSEGEFVGKFIKQ